MAPRGQEGRQEGVLSGEVGQHSFQWAAPARRGRGLATWAMVTATTRHRAIGDDG